MTTITIERELLEEVVEIFDNAISTRYPHEILHDIRAALSAPATAPDELERLRKDAERKPMTETEIVKCLVQAGCIGTVKMTFESGPYDITRPSIKADNLVREVEAFHGIKGEKP